MAIVRNTTKSIKKVSTVYQNKIEETEKNMKSIVKKIYGVDDYKTVKCMIPLSSPNDDVYHGSINSVEFTFLRGKMIALPEPLYNSLEARGLFNV